MIRLTYIDNIKAFAMICVVIGHVMHFVVWKDDYIDHFSFNLIYSFHMPLFMLVSGYTSSIVKHRDNKLSDIIKKRATQLLLPFLYGLLLVAFEEMMQDG